MPASFSAAIPWPTRKPRIAGSSPTCSCTLAVPASTRSRTWPPPFCKHIQTRDNNWSSSNNARSCDPEYDELFAQLEQTRIGPEREALVKLLNDTYVQGYYEIPLVDRGAVSAHLNTLLGVRINGWDSELWNIAEWRR